MYLALQILLIALAVPAALLVVYLLARVLASAVARSWYETFHQPEDKE